MTLLQRFMQEEDALGTVELILIIVVLVGLVAIFKKQLVSLVKNILAKITKQSNSIEKVTCQRNTYQLRHISQRKKVSLEKIRKYNGIHQSFSGSLSAGLSGTSAVGTDWRRARTGGNRCGRRSVFGICRV